LLITGPKLVSSGLIVCAETTVPPSFFHSPVTVGLLVVDRRDLLQALVLVEIPGGERSLDVVGGAGPEVVRVGPLRIVRILTLGQGDTGVGRRDLDDLGAVQDRLHGLGDRGVQRAHHADDLLVTCQGGRCVLTGRRCGLVVLCVEFQRPPRNGLVLVGLLDGQIH
jgi:hypothetical protein